MVVQAIPKVVAQIVVVNNNSNDSTKAVAELAGAKVLNEANPGYGYACLKGIEFLEIEHPDTDIVVFLDGDYADYPEFLPELCKPIERGDLDFVLGARVASLRQDNSMTPQQVFGNALATRLMKLFFKSTFTDLGPFRAIRFSTLLDLKMQDKTYGWTVEMQLKVLKKGIRYLEIPVPYRERIGVSKVSGTLKGTIMAGYKIIGWILIYGLFKK
jgi:glycosyltransferase involved in cell wall biosynthesis